MRFTTEEKHYAQDHILDILAGGILSRREAGEITAREANTIRLLAARIARSYGYHTWTGIVHHGFPIVEE